VGTTATCPNIEKTRASGGLIGSFKSARFGPGIRLKWLKIVIASALLCGFVLSWRLWVSSRLFPLAPVWDSLPSIPFPLDYIWFSSLFALLASIIFTTQPRKLVLIFLVLAGLLSLWDQTRWQPWFYLYFFMLAAIGFCGWKQSEAYGRQAALGACRLMIVCTYFWSGAQKLNASFIKETWPDMARVVAGHLPAGMRGLMTTALAIPLVEMAIAVGLATRRYRPIAVASAIATHLFVLLLLISSGENAVVWPWNLAMVLFVLILFWRDKETSPRRIIVGGRFHAFVFLLFAVAPAFSFSDLWDSYLSAALYSGNTDQAVIYLSPAAIDHMPAAIHPHIWTSSQPFFLDANRWSYGELNVPLYPEPRVYKKIAQRVCAYAGNSSSDIRLRIKQKPNPLTGIRKSEFYDCDHIE
jgi:hypothetical protein